MQMHEIRRAIVAACLDMNRLGLNQGTSGNISVRCGEAMLVTPTATPYDRLAPEMLASLRLADEEGRFSGPMAPSSEWRFHRDIYRARPDVGAVVHCHATYATVLSMLRVNIPAAHYMIAAFGGGEIKCTDYAPYGTAELSALVVEGSGRVTACCLARTALSRRAPISTPPCGGRWNWRRWRSNIILRARWASRWC